MPDPVQISRDILLLGDPAIDHFIVALPPIGGQTSPDWAHYGTWKMWTLRGGVHMTRDMLVSHGFDVTMAGPQHVKTSGECEDKKTHVESLANVRYVDAAGQFLEHRPDAPLELRVSSFGGYRTSTQPALQSCISETCPDGSWPLVILNDASGGLREREDIWGPPLFERQVPDRTILHKMHLPLGEGRLWDRVATLSEVRRILIVNANNLRASGVRLVRGLSWELVVEDLLRQAGETTGLLPKLLSGCDHLLVLFDVEGAAILSRNAASVTTLDLLFDPALAEGDVEKEQAGDLFGKMNSFTTALARGIAEAGPLSGSGDLCGPVLRALAWQRAFAQSRLTENGDALAFPMPEPSQEQLNSCRCEKNLTLRGPKQRVVVPRSTSNRNLAESIVRNGLRVLSDVPSARFGKFFTVDRTEIEGYRAINRLIRGYLKDTGATKPLSIAVFGPPGAGKSFGIKQMVEPLKLEEKVFNLSEATADDLPGFFHEIRDENLKGRTPLCFFDEFDSHKLSLVKHFLAPMQDGTFREGARLHPIGRGLFVFAGGTSHTFRDLASKAPKEPELKLTDFVSRLSGHIDVRGPDRGDNGSDDDHILRRAILLRSLLEQNAASIIDTTTGEASVDDGVLNAFLMVPAFRHGARSMEKIIQMSTLGPQASRYAVSDLPETDQLDMHVDAGEFERRALGG
ncbi:hypothetical protein [Stappia sp. ES.058]|uniref:hypothetical protein n=1 Tax=Stappia sp. ES.058 TaxID=1881061 RepID=UPI000879F90A|nr:hypothetical protein [Stappia sp. ES.058]SDU13810.1 hypothetical protein SAMN05428979_1858 [Stappia sp. ES.058]